MLCHAKRADGQHWSVPHEVLNGPLDKARLKPNIPEPSTVSSHGHTWAGCWSKQGKVQAS